MIQKASYCEFPLEEYLGRLARIRQQMESARVDALFLTMHDNITYFSGFRTWLRISRHRPFALLIPASRDPVLFVPPIEAGDAEAFSWLSDVRLWPESPESAGDYINLWFETLGEMGLQRARIATELGQDTQVGMCFEDFDKFRACLPNVVWSDAARLIWPVRFIKSALEIERLRQAAMITDASVAACWESLRPGATQRELASVIGATMMAQGADQVSFLIVRTGEDGWYMGNPPSTDRPVKAGEMVHLDIGCVYRDYCSDMMRVASVGEPSPAYRKQHEDALLVAQVVRDAVRPGMTIGDLARVRSKITAEIGAKAKWPGIGHAIGLSTHELPRVGPGKDECCVLSPGAVFTVEPGLSFDGRLSVVEDMIVVTDTGGATLTNAPRELFVSPTE